MSLLFPKFTKILVSSSSRVRFTPQICKLCSVPSFTTSEFLNHKRKWGFPGLLMSPKAQWETVRHYGADSTDSMVVLKDKDGDLANKITEFKEKQMEEFLVFLEMIHYKELDPLSTLKALQTLLSVLDRDSPSAELRRSWGKHVGMQKFLRTLRMQSRVMDVNLLFHSLKLCSALAVPGSNTTLQIIVKMLSKHVNIMEVNQIFYLNRLLQNLPDISTSSLTSALKHSIPVVYESKLRMRALRQDNPSILSDFLNFAVRSQCSDDIIAQIVKALADKSAALTVKDCRNLLWGLADLGTLPAEAEMLLPVVFGTLVANSEQLDAKELHLSLVKCSRMCSRRNRSPFYNEDFVDLSLNKLVESGQKEYLFDGLRAAVMMKHIHVDILETCADLLTSNPTAILNDDKLFYLCLMAYADFNYKPEKWDTLKEIFLNHPALTKTPTRRDFKTVLNFMTLDVLPSTFLESVISSLYKPEGKLEQDFDLVLLTNAIKTLYPNYDGPELPFSKFNEWSESKRSIVKNYSYSLKDTLEVGLGGSSYVLTGLVHNGIFIDHCVVLRKGGYPVFQSNPNPDNLEMIDRPENSSLIIIKFDRRGHLRNTSRLAGMFALEKKILDSYGDCVYINVKEWKELKDSRKLPYLMEILRKHAGTAPV